MVDIYIYIYYSHIQICVCTNIYVHVYTCVCICMCAYIRRVRAMYITALSYELQKTSLEALVSRRWPQVRFRRCEFREGAESRKTWGCRTLQKNWNGIMYPKTLQPPFWLVQSLKVPFHIVVTFFTKQVLTIRWHAQLG